MKNFERQSSNLLGERINLLQPFYSLSTRSSIANNRQFVVELCHEIKLCRSKIAELENKIITCEEAQRLSEQVELEYEELLKFVYNQIQRYRANEINQLKQIRANDQLVQKLFDYLSFYTKKSNDEHVLSQLKYEYQQQQFISFTDQPNNDDIWI